MYLGISSYTYKWSFGIRGYPKPEQPLDAEQLILRADALGVDLVQICDNFPLHTKTGDELSKLKALADEMNIIIEIGTAGTDPEVLLRYLDIARQLNAKLIRSRIGTQEKMENMNTAERNLERIIEAYEEHRVALALENYELYSVKELADLIIRLNSPILGACLDTGNSLAALETPDIVVDTLSAYTMCLHIKDFRFERVDYGLGYTVQGCPVGEGLINVESIFERLKPYGKLTSVVLEQWTPFQGSIEDTLIIQDQWVEKSLQYLKRFVP